MTIYIHMFVEAKKYLCKCLKVVIPQLKRLGFNCVCSQLDSQSQHTTNNVFKKLLRKPLNRSVTCVHCQNVGKQLIRV